MGLKKLSDKLLQSVTPRVYNLIYTDLNNEEKLTRGSFEISSLTRKVILHDIPSLQMTAAQNGLAALSSPTIGLSNALIVYNKTLVNNQWDGYKSSPSDYEIMINPSIARHSEETQKAEEECTSIPSLYFEISRPIAIEVSYKDINFIDKCSQFFNFPARVISHEIDHLQGCLPSNLKVCQGKMRQKMSFENLEQIEKTYEALCKDDIAKLEVLYNKDKKFKVQTDGQNDKKEFFMRIVLGDEKFDEYVMKRTEAFKKDMASKKYPMNTQFND